MKCLLGKASDLRAALFKMNKQTNKPTNEKLNKPNEPQKQPASLC